METPCTSNDRTPSCAPDAGVLTSLDPSQVDPLANRPGPPNPPDLSDRRGLCPRPTSPAQEAAGGDDDLMVSSHPSPGDRVPTDAGHDSIAAGGDGGGGDGGDDNAAPPQPNKGKAPETVNPPPASEQGPHTESFEAALGDVQQASNPTTMNYEYLEACAGLIEITASEEGYESSSHATHPESQDASYPPSLLEEAGDHDSAATTSPALADQVMSWKQKQKQKADPRAETESPVEAFEEESSFQPLIPEHPGWEKSAGRPPQKLPIRFRDAVGRNFLFPWEKAKTWTGMRGLVQSCFVHVEILGPHVMAGRYDLSVNLPFSMDATNDIMLPDTLLSPVSTPAPTSIAETSSSSAAGPSSVPGPSGVTSSSQQQQQHKSSFVVIPELWEDTIEPGMLVVQHMWPPTSNYITQPIQPSPPQPHHHGLPGVHPPGPGRGRGTHGRGRGAGAVVFGGRGGVPGGVFPPLPHPGSVRPPPMINVNVDPPHRGKTRKRQDRR